MLDNPVNIILTALAVLITLSVHEYCHGYAAYKLGDNTAKNLGRLTLNPIKHIDPIGALCMLLFKVGWAKPLPINPRNFNNPKRDFALTALAGPLSNLIMAFFSAGIYLLIFAIFKNSYFEPGAFALKLVTNTITFIWIFHSVNIGLGIFNLIPIPPLDGSRLLNVFLPPKAYFGIMKYERQIYFAVLGWLLLGDYVARAVRLIPLVSEFPVLSALASIFSLSELLGTAISFLSGLMIDLWQLIPFLRF